MTAEAREGTPAGAAWLRRWGGRDHPELLALQAATDRLAHGAMRSALDQVRLLAFLVELTGARRVLEVGCFTGFATLAMALALPPDGRIVTLDVNGDWAAIGRAHWRRAGVEGRIELRLGLAADSLERLRAAPAAHAFDLAYIDADKKSYEAYLAAALDLVRPGGIIALDNMLWRGGVAAPDDDSRQATTLRRLTRAVHADERLTPLILPLGDGLLLARRR